MAQRFPNKPLAQRWRGKLSGLILSPTDFSSASFLLGGEDGSLEFNELATLGIAKELFVLSPLF